MRCVAVVCWFAMLLFCSGQVNAERMNQSSKHQTITSVNRLLSEYYVFPKVAEAMSEDIGLRLRNGEYDDIDDATVFADTLTNDLRLISKDKHLGIRFDPERVKDKQAKHGSEEGSEEGSKEESFTREYLREARQRNYGFHSVEILQGNVGYVDVREFYDPSIAGDTAVAAMNFLASSDALIFDLRKHIGGVPSMVQLITSYLYGSEPVHLNDFYWRPTDTLTQSWTLPYVQGNRSPNTPVYILTSKRTFSAAEEFSYNLKHLERATLIGETTRGGAHPVGTEVVNQQFIMYLPLGRAINPKTKNNWEGVGVVPHIKVNAKDALAIAHERALADLSDANQGEEGYKFRWYLAEIQSKNTPVVLSESQVARYVGVYGPRTISLESGQLYYQRKGRDKFRMSAINPTTFAIEGSPGFRIQMLVEGDEAFAIRALYDDGHSSESPRTR